MNNREGNLLAQTKSKNQQSNQAPAAGSIKSNVPRYQRGKNGEILAALKELYPEAFKEVRLLAIDCHQIIVPALVERGFRKVECERFFNAYTRSNRYLWLLSSNFKRVDLLGNPAGRPPSEVRKSAEAELKNRKA